MTTEKIFLTIDIGNTKTAIGLFRSSELVCSAKKPTNELNSSIDFLALINQVQNPDCQINPSKIMVGICSVVPAKTTIVKQMLEEQEFQHSLFLSSKVSLPFENCYETPHTLGVDRLALAACAKACFPNEAAIIIDFGTAITYDVVTSKNAYLGGLILAGPRIISKCLHEKTAQLPDVMLERETGILGTTTEKSLQRGLYWGLIAQTKALIAQIKYDLMKTYHEPSCKVLVTGGYHELIAEHIPDIDVREPYAVLRGIQSLLECNMPALHKKV